MESIIMIPINQITSFPNHPFKVRDDEKMMETVESVKRSYFSSNSKKEKRWHL